MSKGLLLIGIILLGIAVYMGYNKYTFLENAIKTKAIVVSYRTTTEKETRKNGNKRTTKNTTYYYPKFEFKDIQNRLIQVESNVGQGNSKPYSIGSQVEIVYSKENPQEAKINSFLNQWLFTTIVGGFSLLFLIIAFAFQRKK
ncbi:DUF3592 domain-containing protein [Chryseobacterium sp. C-71]|uniref:DUF3592 domain-containing protein n=1 Tax=Chryseobacterium sp. C-71 TaxID=2893882 RepID=UPI001E2F9B0B|nr:DUF3592 domain-containing protein [Chryseobacterium sp. C-71]UFH33711.1 DUF3592 domain-containing protein [Chryseobacterium sp. C-71]